MKVVVSYPEKLFLEIPVFGALTGNRVEEYRLRYSDIASLLAASDEQIRGILGQMICRFAPGAE